MKKETKKKIKNFTLDVLDIFLGIPEAIVYGFDRKEFYRYMHGASHEQELTCKNIAKMIANLKRSGYIEIDKTPKGESIRFTNKARLALVDRIAEKSPSDKKHRFISFDIPERLRTKRDRFRFFIKRLGFKQIQKSLWICHKNVGDLVELAATEYGVSDCVVYIVSENTNIEKTISMMFSKKKTSYKNPRSWNI